ncbi:transposase [Geminocystis sp. CENA526]|uniref:transposase n=1 Tax=Geminocystis sp. CENA526 TaxID=1355871 RepID=UPI003D6DAAA1
MNQNEDSSRLYSNLSSDTLDTAKGFLFGVYIPFLPDFLLDHTLLGKEPSDRIQEHSKRWTQFVSGLWRGSGDVTYSLRFNLHETHKRIYVYLLGRLHTTYNNPQSINQVIVSIPPKISISEYVQKIKGSTSHYLTEKYFSPFQWQKGYGVFSISQKNLSQAIEYVKNQKKHHANSTTIAMLEDIKNEDDPPLKYFQK